MLMSSSDPERPMGRLTLTACPRSGKNTVYYTYCALYLSLEWHRFGKRLIVIKRRH